MNATHARSGIHIAVITLFVVFVVCCEQSPAGPIDAGVWGSSAAVLNVTADGATLESFCAHGVLNEKITITAQRTFDVAGTLTFQNGGPTREGDAQPARFTGSEDGTDITITGQTVDKSRSVGPFTLKRGVNTNLSCPIV